MRVMGRPEDFIELQLLINDIVIKFRQSLLSLQISFARLKHQ